VKHRDGDRVTPTGAYHVSELRRSTHWEWDGQRLFGPYFLRLAPQEPFTGLGLHGAGWSQEGDPLDPRASRGCINVTNTDLRWLVDELQVGPGAIVLVGATEEWAVRERDRTIRFVEIEPGILEGSSA